MNRQSIPLLSPAIGTHREQLVSFHFGPQNSGQKIYIQASLHADETPAMLTTVLLKRRLLELEKAGALNAEIVLVPVANPVGLGQYVLGQFLGRFDLGSGKNFNRHFLQLTKLVARAKETLGADVDENRRLVRELIAAELAEQKPLTEFESLQLAMLKLSRDVDVVIDLHCSLEAAMHVYTSEAAWPEFEPLSRYLGAQASLLATNSGGEAFDETHSLLWWQLQQEMPADKPVLTGAIAVTVECRGQRDVSYEVAQQDADALVEYLVWRKAIRGDAKPLPELLTPSHAARRQRTVLRAREWHSDSSREDWRDDSRGSAALRYRRSVGRRNHDDFEQYRRRPVHAPRNPLVTSGAPLGHVTGAKAFRTGVLLGA